MKRTVYKELGEEVWRERLFNGLQVTVVPKRSFSRAYALLAVRCGGHDLAFSLNGAHREVPAGMAHFLEHMMFYMPYGTASDALEANGASANAFTTPEITGYHFSCNERFEENLGILLDFVTTPFFPAESVEKERSIITQEIRMGEDDPARRLYRNLDRALYENPLMWEPVAGTAASIAEITPALLEEFYRAFYSPENMILCVSGNVEPEAVRRVAMEKFHAKSAGTLLRDRGEPEGLLPLRLRTEETMPVSATLFAFGAKLPMPGSGREQLRKRLAGNLACDLLAGSSSPLFERLYEAGLVDPNFSCGVSNTLSGSTVLISGESKDPAAVMEQLSAEAETLAKGGGEALFERLKRAALGAFIRVFDDMEGICSLEANEYYRDCSLFEGRETLQAVTLEEVRAFLRENLALERFALSVIRPDKEKGE